MSKMEDVFYTEYTDKENEKKIYNIEEQNKIEKIKNSAYNEGYLSKASQFYEDEYNKGYKDGENYSLEYGKLLGVIDCIKFFEENVFDSSKISEANKNELNIISKELEEFKDKLDDNIIHTYSERLDTILKSIIKI